MQTTFFGGTFNSILKVFISSKYQKTACGNSQPLEREKVHICNHKTSVNNKLNLIIPSYHLPLTISEHCTLEM